MKKLFTTLLRFSFVFSCFMACVLSAQNSTNNIPQLKTQQTPQTPYQAQNLTPIAPQQSNIQAPQQPSPEEIEKQRKAQLEAKKQQLQKTFFSEINPATDKIGETFFEKYKYWLIGGIIALITVLAFIFKPKKKPILTPYQEAVVRFQALLKIADALEVKPYAEEVSQRVRDYIDKVYSIPAPERTTQEFLEIAHQSKIFSNESKQDLAEILKLADMAKFAKHSFSKNERTQIFETSKKFVEDDNLRLIKEKQKSSKQ